MRPQDKPGLSASSDARNTFLPVVPAARQAPGDTAGPHSAAKRRTRNRFSYLAASSSCFCPRFCCCCRGGGLADLLVPLRRLSLFLSLDRWGALGVPPAAVGCAWPSTPGNQIRLLLKIAVCSLPLSLLQSPLNASFTAAPHYICRS